MVIGGLVTLKNQNLGCNIVGSIVGGLVILTNGMKPGDLGCNVVGGTVGCGNMLAAQMEYPSPEFGGV